MTVTTITTTMMITPVMGIKTHSERTLEASFLPLVAGDAGRAIDATESREQAGRTGRSPRQQRPAEGQQEPGEGIRRRYQRTGKAPAFV